MFWEPRKTQARIKSGIWCSSRDGSSGKETVSFSSLQTGVYQREVVVAASLGEPQPTDGTGTGGLDGKMRGREREIEGRLILKDYITTI